MNLGHNALSGKYLQELKNFPNLRWLGLGSDHLKDSDLVNVSACSKLEFLDISDNKDLTEKGLAPLKKLKNLSCLRLNYTNLTAKGILQLKGVPLQLIRIEKHQANVQDLAALRRAFPHITVDFEAQMEDLRKDYHAAFE